MSSEGILHTVFDVQAKILEVFFKNFTTAYTYPEGIKLIHIRVMATLFFEGPQVMTKVSKTVGLRKGSFTTIADRLLGKGYIARIQDNKDRRLFFLELTKEGIILVKKVINDHGTYIENILSALPDEKNDEFRRSLNIIINTFEQLKTD